MSKKPRTKLLIDRDVQMTIVFRVVFYWAACTCFISLPQMIARSLMHPQVPIVDQIGSVLLEHWSIYLVLCVMLPFAIHDALRLSNRFAGPVFQIRKSLKNFNETGAFTRVTIRNGDFWHELADEVNAAVPALKESAAELQEEAIAS